MTTNMLELLTLMVDRRASDLHLNPGAYPALRVHGEIVALTEYEILTAEDTQRLIYSVLAEAQKKRFEEESELDVSFGVKGLARFRANVYLQRGAVTAALRLVPSEIPSLQELGLPPVVEQLTQRRKGLVLVCGPTGSGKSTTLAAMIDKINAERAGHIVILEDPIEFLHQHKKCVVSQREVGADTRSFQRALRSALRQDADVVMLGEMRDLETIQTALTIAETGHLTLATLHTNSCAA
jgi:twitching motility protein PilT